MWPLIAALFAQELVQDSAGNFVLARDVKVGGPNPPFLTKFVEGGAKVAWTVLPEGQRGAMTLGSGDSVLYVNEKGLEQYAPEGRLIARYAVAWECPVRVWSARFTKRAQLAVTGEADCALQSIGNGVRATTLLGTRHPFTAVIEPRGGAIRWLAPEVGGGWLEEAADGSLLVASRGAWSVARLSAEGTTLLGRLVLGGTNEEAPVWLAELPDGRVGVAGTLRGGGLATSLDAGQREFAGSESAPFTNGYIAVLAGDLSRVTYASYLATEGNLASVVGVRVLGQRVEAWGETRDARKQNSPWFDRFCPGYSARWAAPLANLTGWELGLLPSQVALQSLYLPAGEKRYVYSPSHAIDQLLTGNVDAPELDFCVRSAIDGEPVRNLTAGSYYSLFFAGPRLDARVSLDAKELMRTYSSATQINFVAPPNFFQGAFALDGKAYWWAQRDNRWPRVLNAEPFGTARPRLALVTDERGQLVTESNAPGPGERILVYTERAPPIFIRSAPDDYPPFFNYGLSPVAVTELSGFPNLYVHELRIPMGRPTEKARRFYIGGTVTGAGPDGSQFTWLRLQY